MRIEGDGEVTEIIRLTCIEQGVALTNEEKMPVITIQGIKLALFLPNEEATNPSSTIIDNRGENGKSA